jgi:hypothetical protein
MSFNEPGALSNEKYQFQLSLAEPVVLLGGQVSTVTMELFATINTPKSVNKVQQLNGNFNNLILDEIILTTNSGRIMTEQISAY